MSSVPAIAITMGDPAGIGPEICLKLLQLPELLEICIPVIFGNAEILTRTATEMSSPESLSLLADLSCIRLAYDQDAKIGELTNQRNETGGLSRPTQEPDHSSIAGSEKFDPVEPNSLRHRISAGQPILIDFVSDRISDVQTGRVSKSAGDAAFRYIDTAIAWCQNGLVDGITTGPINKLALHAAGHDFPGHTEIFASRTQTPNYCMMQYSPELSCAFVTTHVGYSEVVALMSTERILEVIMLSAAAMRNLVNSEPALVVCGLNPHAGENGLFGNFEEERIIAPAIEQARQLGINVSGPYPPDTCFIPSRRKSTDCFICMYHDQGHIPLKALVFDQAVNMTLGLPIIRTSVDHGTAFDIAGKNLADPSSLIHAVKLAAKLASSKRQ